MLRLLKISFQRDPVKTAIFLSIGLTHLIFAIWIMTSHAIITPKRTHKSIIVKTIVPKSAGKTAISDKPRALAAAPRPAAQPQPKPAMPTPVKTAPPVEKALTVKPAPQEKKNPPPVEKVQTVKKEAAPKKDPAIQDKVVSKVKPPTPKKNTPTPSRAKISENLFQELEESIAKIDAKRDKLYPKKLHAAQKPIIAPLQIDAFAVGEDAASSGGAATYAESLVHYLQQSLNLPEYGEVKVQLTLRQDGIVIKIVVLKSESNNNRKHLETNLPKLKFPRFEGELAKNREQTFTLTFCNEV